MFVRCCYMFGVCILVQANMMNVAEHISNICIAMFVAYVYMWETCGTTETSASIDTTAPAHGLFYLFFCERADSWNSMYFKRIRFRIGFLYARASRCAAAVLMLMPHLRSSERLCSHVTFSVSHMRAARAVRALCVCIWLCWDVRERVVCTANDTEHSQHHMIAPRPVCVWVDVCWAVGEVLAVHYVYVSCISHVYIFAYNSGRARIQ